jgi:tryptophanyl-tRNA synthetase
MAGPNVISKQETGYAPVPEQNQSSGKPSDPTITVPILQTEQKVNPWSVSGEVGDDGKVKPIDYKKLVEQFGTKLIDDALIQRFERVTGHKAHRFIRRGLVFSHRDLETILDKYEKHEPFFVYTGQYSYY